MKSLLDKVNAKLNTKEGFLKSISVLVGGTVFAQGVVVLSLPILTRLYSPSEFSIFAVYASLLGVLSTISCLRFELAIPISNKDREAVSLVLLALISNVITSILITFFICLFYNEILIILKIEAFSQLIWLIPVGMFFSGLYITFQYWATRNKKFTAIAQTKVLQSVSGVLTQIIMGITGFSVIGLILGQIVKISAGLYGLIWGFWQDANKYVKEIKFEFLKISFIKYDQYPKYSTLEALANSSAIHLPVILIAAFSTGSDAGYLMLAMQVMMIPMQLIGNAISQVYLGHAPEKYKVGELTHYTKKCVFQLVKIGIIPLAIISLVAPFVFPYVFGGEWKRAGDMMLWMLPWFVMQLIVSPISMSLYIIDKPKLALILQMFGLVFRVGGLLLISIYYQKYMFEYYAISGFIFYSIYLIVVAWSLKNSSIDR